MRTGRGGEGGSGAGGRSGGVVESRHVENH